MEGGWTLRGSPGLDPGSWNPPSCGRALCSLAVKVGRKTTLSVGTLNQVRCGRHQLRCVVVSAPPHCPSRYTSPRSLFETKKGDLGEVKHRSQRCTALGPRTRTGPPPTGSSVWPRLVGTGQGGKGLSVFGAVGVECPRTGRAGRAPTPPWARLSSHRQLPRPAAPRARAARAARLPFSLACGCFLPFL